MCDEALIGFRRLLDDFVVEGFLSLCKILDTFSDVAGLFVNVCIVRAGLF